MDNIDANGGILNVNVRRQVKVEIRKSNGWMNG
jgi:hypothetical protein